MKKIQSVDVKLYSGHIVIELQEPEEDENKALEQAIMIIEEELKSADVREIIY